MPRDTRITKMLETLDRAHKMGCSDPSDPTRRTIYGDAAKLIRDMEGTDAVLRGEIGRAEAALAVFERVVEERDEAKALLADLADADPCWFDHNGGCQAHGFLSLAGAQCPNHRALRLAAIPASAAEGRA